VKAIIYEKKLEKLKPSHILSKIMAHELQLMPKSKKTPQEKPQEPSSPTTSHALSSQQEKMLNRMATHRSSSEDDGDDGDDGDSSGDEEVESMVAEYVKKISMLSMILVQPLLQIMNICCANSHCLARSVMS
jgi:hypothetical protein